jgi:hypothetical protein
MKYNNNFGGNQMFEIKYATPRINVKPFLGRSEICFGSGTVAYAISVC